MSVFIWTRLQCRGKRLINTLRNIGEIRLVSIWISDVLSRYLDINKMAAYRLLALISEKGFLPFE